MKKYLLILFTPLSFYSFSQNRQTVSVYEDSILLSKMKYRLVGPFRGGRSGAVAGDYRQKNTFYFGSTGGGVWKTIDGGSNWKNVSDKYFGGSIGAVAVAPSDNTVVYVGEGENTLRGNVSEGFGMWRSDDAGHSWKNIGLKDTRHIARILIHPKNPDILWVAAIGHLFGPNEARGIFKSTDGGKTWKKVLFSDIHSGGIDLVMEPGNPSVLYASTWTISRTPYSLESGGKGSALWKSIDGGDTWQKLNDKKGFPGKTTLGNICVAVSASSPERIYALVESEKGGLLRSDDAGETWTNVSVDPNIRQRAWYFNRIFVDPKNADIVYALNVSMYRSTDGGKTFKPVNTPHGDHHDLWIDPEDGNRMIVADDGGAQISFDAGANWSTYNNQPTAQFYRVSTDNNFPYRILAAQQDNSTVRILSRTESNEIGQSNWSSTAGFESGYVVADPLNPDIVYGGNYGGFISRFDHKTGENRAVSVWPDNPLGGGVDLIKYRFQWNFPIFFSPHDPKKIYTAANVLFASENEGASWTAISGDLTTNDKSRQKSSGGPITQDNTGVEIYCTIFTAGESPYEKDLLWTGSDDGLINVSKDGGQHWENVTPKEAGKWMIWNCVESDPFKKGAAYFVGTKYKDDDFTPYIFKTEDYGKSWRKITNGIPQTHFARCLRADKKRQGLLYCGTEYGMYISYDDGNNWKSFQLNLPKVPITDLTIKDNDLVVATQGRAFWVLDDLTMLQEKQPGITQKNLHVFTVRDAVRMNGSQDVTVKNAGMNPPNGVVINYFLKNFSDSGLLNISILDRDRKLIKEFNTKAPATGDIGKIDAAKGMNQFVWDMFYPQAEKIDGQILWNGTPGGPKAPPGQYYAKIVSEKKDSTLVPFSIKANPNFKETQQEYDEQFTFLTTVRDKFSEIQKAIKNIHDIRKQINDFMALQGKDTVGEIKILGDSINKRMTRIEEALYQTKAKSGQDVLNYPIRLNDKISGLYDYAASGNYAPTKQVKETYTDLSARADAELNKLKRVMNEDVPRLNQLIRDKKLPVIGVKKE
ncbi:MAG: glycosyl hydrolase [Chitinophagaceae bacterium]|nr:glycosyl hydrolase [Chitinophagaceae bacterium]